MTLDPELQTLAWEVCQLKFSNSAGCSRQSYSKALATSTSEAGPSKRTSNKSLAVQPSSSNEVSCCFRSSWQGGVLDWIQWSMLCVLCCLVCLQQMDRMILMAVYGSIIIVGDHLYLTAVCLLFPTTFWFETTPWEKLSRAPRHTHHQWCTSKCKPKKGPKIGIPSAFCQDFAPHRPVVILHDAFANAFLVFQPGDRCYHEFWLPLHGIQRKSFAELSNFGLHAGFKVLP